MSEKKKSGAKKSVSKREVADEKVEAPRPRAGYDANAGGPPVLTASLCLVGLMATLLTIWFSLHASKSTSSGPAAAPAPAQH